MLFRDGVSVTDLSYARSHSQGKRLIVSLPPSICPHVTRRIPLEGFSWNSIAGTYISVEKFQIWLNLLTYVLTYSTQQSPSWEANRFSASQEIPRILWAPKVHYRIHKCPLPVPILSHLHPVHTPTSHFLKIHLSIIILRSTPGSCKWNLSLRFPHQNRIYAPPFSPYVLHVPSISFFSIISPEQYWESSTDH